MKRIPRDQVFIVIAAYNEHKHIADVVGKVQKAGYKNIVIVNDCSRDDTAQIIEKLPVADLHHIVNRGQGAALKTGIDFALEEGAKYIVTFDADGQHRAQDIDRMVGPVAHGPYDISLGSRFLGKRTDMPLTRFMTLKIGVLIQWIFYGLLLTDAHNGFRCLSRKAAQTITIQSDRMEHASEIIEEIKRHRLTYKEVPIVILYNEETLAKGHGGFAQAIKVLFKMILKKIG